MLKTFATLAVVAIATLPTPAAAKNVWYSATTAQGCTIDWWTNGDVYSQATFKRDVRFSWSGNCPRGGVASGRGRLSQDFIAGNAGGTPPQHWTFDGTLVDGVIHGDAKVTFSQQGQLIWSRNFTHNMGCVAAACVPRPRVTARAAAATVPPLRPTITQEAHNPAAAATDCLEGIFHPDFVARGIKSNMQAVIRNKCARPVTVTWCVKGWDCKPGYSNLGTVPARDYLPVSFVYKGPTRMEFAGCYNGFATGQGDLSKKLLHACK